MSDLESASSVDELLDQLDREDLIMVVRTTMLHLAKSLPDDREIQGLFEMVSKQPKAKLSRERVDQITRAMARLGAIELVGSDSMRIGRTCGEIHQLMKAAARRLMMMTPGKGHA
jgi:hypothetical protein